MHMQNMYTIKKRNLPMTIFGIGMALERHPELAKKFVEYGHEIVSHGWRWIHYQNMDPQMKYI